MNLQALRGQLEASLSVTTGVTSWDTIQFSMLPFEQPKGYFQLVELEPGRTTSTSIWMVGIGIAATSLEALHTQVATLVESVVSTYSNPQDCLGIGGNARLQGPLQVEIPSSYINENAVTTTSAFQTALTFTIAIEAQNGANH